ncbi:MAG TPA: protein kinase [Haliangium sp.]|nr:protein kinase [Haliangium sp.]
MDTPSDSKSGSPVGTQLGRYRIEAKLGAGGMGEVFRALDVDLHRPVALKTLRPEIALDSGNVERFFAEARAANVIRHEHIVEYTDMHKAGPGATSYVVMELLEGRTLTQAIRDRGRIAPERAVFIAAQVADALEAAHRAGVVHRDLKPDNVFLIRRMGTEDYVKVLDFGVARLQPGLSGISAVQATQTGMIIGTPAYMSPEQCKGEKVTPAADIYALGVILFQMLTGQLPFGGVTAPMMLVAHMMNEPPQVHALAPDVPAALSMLVAQALAKQPEERQPSMAAMRDAMLAAVGMEAFGPALTADIPVSSSGAPPAWAQGTPQARPAGTPQAAAPRATPEPAGEPHGDSARDARATLPARGQVPLPDATALQRAQPTQRQPTGDPTVHGRPAAPRPSRPVPVQTPPAEQPGDRALERLFDRATDRAIDELLERPADRFVERLSEQPAERVARQPAPASPPAPAIADHDADRSAFEPRDSDVAPASTQLRDHARPATPAPTLVPTPRARVPGQAAEAAPPATDRSRRRRLVIGATALLACATAGVLWSVYVRRDPGQVALAPDAGRPVGPEDGTEDTTAERAPALRRQLDALITTHEEPVAPAACQTRDAALLERLVRAATLLQGGAPDGRREQDIEAVRLLAEPPPAPGAAEHWYWLAKARLYADADVGAVTDAAGRALAACEGYAAAHNAVGSALFRDQPAEAATAYREAVNLSPGFARARFNLGLIHLQHGEPDEGLGSLTAIIDDPKAPPALRAEALLARGQTLLQMRQVERAVADLERASDAAPGDARVMFLLGQAYGVAGRADAARDAMCKARELGHAPAAEHCPQ